MSAKRSKSSAAQAQAGSTDPARVSKDDRDAENKTRKQAMMVDDKNRCLFCRIRPWVNHPGFCESCFRSSQCKSGQPPDELKWTFKQLIHVAKLIVTDDLIVNPAVGSISLKPEMQQKKIVYGKISSAQPFHVIIVNLLDRNKRVIETFRTDNHGVFCFLVNEPIELWPLELQAYDEKAEKDSLYVQLDYKKHMIARHRVHHRTQLLLYAPMQLPEPETSIQFILNCITEKVSTLQEQQGVVSNEELDRLGLMYLAVNEMMPRQEVIVASRPKQSLLRIKSSSACKVEAEEEEEEDEEEDSDDDDEDDDEDDDDENDDESVADSDDSDCDDADEEDQCGAAAEAGCTSGKCRCHESQDHFVPELSAETVDQIRQTQSMLLEHRQRLQQQLKSRCLLELLGAIPGASAFNLRIIKEGIAPRMSFQNLEEVQLQVVVNQACFVYALQREGSDCISLLSEVDLTEPNCGPGFELYLPVSSKREHTTGHTLSVYVFALDKPLTSFSAHILDGFRPDAEPSSIRLDSIKGLTFGKRDFSQVDIHLLP